MSLQPAFLLQLGWFLATVSLIVGLRRLSSPRHARRGAHLIALGLGLAIAAAFGHPAIGPNLALVLIAMLAGGAAVIVPVRNTPIADSARLIALFNALGGAAAAAIAAMTLARPAVRDAGVASAHGGSDGAFAVFALLCGAIAAGGSAVAWRRMRGGAGPSGRFAKRQVVYLANALLVLLLALVLSASSSAHPVLLGVFAVAAVTFGVGMSQPIATADMPVLIALYNAIAGLGVLLDGMLIDNPTMIVAGSLVFAAGSLLMRLTARAMNRRLGDVMYSGFGLGLEGTIGGGGRRSSAGDGSSRAGARRIDAAEAAIALGYAARVRVVPGYGLAISRAHHKLRELVQLLEERGVVVDFALHPVAGRLPGHMNVLLAEAGVPYERIVDAADANESMTDIDVALVIGADDIVNPASRGADAGDLAGLRIIDVERAGRTIWLRRGDGIGHAGIANPLLDAPHTQVMPGDALDSVQSLIDEVKTLD